MKANLEKKRAQQSEQAAASQSEPAKHVTNEDLDKLLRELDFKDDDIAKPSNGIKHKNNVKKGKSKK